MANENANEERRVDIGNGSSITAPAGLGLVITPIEQVAQPREFRSASFDGRLREEGLDRKTIVAVDPLPPRPAGARALAPEAAQAATIDVPTDDKSAAIVQIEHENGAITWYVPSSQTAGTSSFTIPAADLAAVATAPGARGLNLGGIGKKLLKVFTFPITAIENKIADVAAGFAAAWERKSRPYLVRLYTPELFEGPAPALDAADWDRLAGGRALLFVHGTFSSCDAFRGIPKAVIAELSERYGGRVFAFNHPTLCDDPAENARVLLDAIPQAARRLDIDIVCHSRGGLVSREIANQGDSRGVRVRRIVFVGATNNGTALADEKHIVDMVNRYSTIARVIPNQVTETIVDALTVVLKVAARALLHDLPGLLAMNPNGDFVKRIDSGPTKAEKLFAIAANFEPPVGSPFVSVARAEDALVDAVFQQADNDLVVPTAGVFTCPAPDFPIDTPAIFDASAGVVHTHFFEQPLTHERLLDWLEPPVTRALALARGTRLTGDELQALKPHVINLHDGAFSTSGRFTTSSREVNAIFTDSLPAFERALPAGAPLRIVFWAHGGLVDEEEGLAVAQKHVTWWKRNGVYPIYFVWESGLFDALGSILSHAGTATAARGLTDFTDGIVEAMVRKLRGDAIWGAMKTSAGRASAKGGGARYVLEQLAKFTPGLQRPLELHAVGHSAGSIVHSYLLPAAAQLKIPSFTTLQLLAPAIRVDEFKARLLPLAGSAFDQLVMYSMDDAHEQDDNCIGVYRKSLLYLIYHSLEGRDREPILGLQVSADNDQEVRTFLAGGRARAVWSVSQNSAGRDATQSTNHGGFDDDGSTMTSVAINVLGGDVAAAKPYEGDGRRGRGWPISADLRVAITPAAADTTGIPAAPPIAAVALSAPAIIGVTPTGRRTALCVGIDAYPEPNRLSGCVSDARQWQAVFQQHLGFQEVLRLEDREATHDRILGELRRMVSQARAGDVLAFHYSGHGTTLPDDDGDEEDGNDEAMVPVDFADGRFIRDDDLRGIFSELADGVGLTCFMDCCHSGTITRVLGRTSRAGSGKARFMTVAPNSDVALKELARRHRDRAAGYTRAFVDRTALKWITFSACDPTELAYESQGNGAFTRETVKLLQRGADGLTNGDAQRRIVDAFGPKRAQTPQLDCAPGAEGLFVLSVGAAKSAHAAIAPAAAGDGGAGDRRSGSNDRRALVLPVSSYNRRSSTGGRRAGDAGDHAEALREAAAFLERL
jgi:hypothetical protein